MDYKVVITEDAEADLNRFIDYILFKLKNEQAAKSLLDDFELSKKSLSYMAGSLRFCENPRLKNMGYRRMNFQTHRYFMLYRIKGNMVIVDNIFHELQDYEQRFY